MPALLIERANGLPAEAASCDFSFLIDALLEPRLDQPVSAWPATPLPPRRKAYGLSAGDHQGLGGSDDHALFLARLGGRLAGYVVLSRHWNGYALIDDIAVDAAARRGGVGAALLARAEAWARERQLPGLMLETQNNNAGACLFYERHGFALGGFDRMLYRALEPGTQEVALFWYRLLG